MFTITEKYLVTFVLGVLKFTHCIYYTFIWQFKRQSVSRNVIGQTGKLVDVDSRHFKGAALMLCGRRQAYIKQSAILN